MAKKSSLTLLTVMLLAIGVSGLFADVFWYDGSPDNHYWGNPMNWGSLGRVPTVGDGIVRIKQGLSAQWGQPDGGSDPIIHSTEPNVTSLFIGDNEPGLAEVTVLEDGYLEIMDTLRVGQWLSAGNVPKSHGRLNMYGGRIDVRAVTDVGQRNSNGTLYMKNGILTTPILNVRGDPERNDIALVDLHGGLIDVGSGGITYGSNSQGYSKINITGGTLRSAGTTGLGTWHVTVGYITAYDGYGTVVIDTTSEPGYTIAYAEPYYKAYSPSPADGSVVSAMDAATVILSWKAGFGAEMHDLYFGTDEALVAAGDSSVYIDTLSDTQYDPNGLAIETVYYWRVDQFDGEDTVVGDVWSFTVDADLLPEMASEPNPANGAVDVSTATTLSWTAGVGAVSRDVYLGTNQALVAAGDESVFMGNIDTTEFDPIGLNSATTYYWRVDEFDGDNLWEGVVWTFTTQAPSGNIVWIEGNPGNNWNTASNWNALVVPNANFANTIVRPGITTEYPVVDTPVPAINIFILGDNAGTGDGFLTIEDGGSLRSVGARFRLGQYFAAAPAQTQRGILNVNGGELIVDNDLQVGIHYSDGVLTMTGGYVQANVLNAPGGTFSNGYINLNGGTLRIGSGGLNLHNEPESNRQRVGKIDIGDGVLELVGNRVSTMNWYISAGYMTAYGSANGGLLGEPEFIEGGHPQADIIVHYSSETNITTVTAYMPDPKQASSPSPASSAGNVGLLSTLSWQAGEDAVSRRVYFGTDEQLVIDGDASVDMGSQTETTFDPQNLEAETTYYWRVDEFDGSVTTEGNIWYFTTGTGQIIEDFESYANTSELTAVWTAGGGALISLEDELVGDDGEQAMKINFAGTTSTATIEFDQPQDWTRSEISSINIPLHGDENNTPTQLSATIEDNFAASATVVYDNEFMNQSPENIVRAPYRDYLPWRIDLAQFGAVDLSAVKKLTITIGNGVDVSIGTVYFDNIGVYAPLCLPGLIPADITGDCEVGMDDLYALAANWLEADTVVEASAAQTDGLIAHWNFDGNANDSATGIYNGTIGGTVTWDPTGGYDGGGCAVFNGAGWITIANAESLFSNITDQLTVSVWVKGDENHQPINGCLFVGADYDYMGHNPFVYMPQGNGNVRFDAGHVSEQEPDWESWFYGWDELIWSEPDFSDWAGQWVHYAFVKDASEGFMRIYRDGELVAELLGAFVTMEGTQTFTIGALDRGTYRSMQYRGKIDDMRIYNTVLPQEQIVDLANQASVAQPLVTPADGNRDGKVDLIDFSEISYFWMQEVSWPY